MGHCEADWRRATAQSDTRINITDSVISFYQGQTIRNADFI